MKHVTAGHLNAGMGEFDVEVSTSSPSVKKADKWMHNE
jgi:hypothetical protein